MRLLSLGISSFILGLVLVLASPVKANTDMSAVLERMDEIIAEMQVLRTEFAVLSKQVGTTVSTPAVLGVQTTAGGFTESLEYGVTNDDISYIQKLLATDPEIYPEAIVSGFFGPKTQEAIRKLQTRFNLDPVGVIGPATRTILETFKKAFPTGAFPDGVLKQVPQVQGASTSISPVQSPVTRPTVSDNSNPFYSIEGEIDRGEAEVRVEYKNGKTSRIIVDGDDEGEVAKNIAKRTGQSVAHVLAVLDLGNEKPSNGGDEDDAEEAIEDAEDAIDDADEAIDEAKDDDEDIDDAEDMLDEAEEYLEEAEDAFDDEDYERAISKAKKAKSKAKDAEDAIGGKSSRKGDSDDIDEIRVDIVGKDEAEVKVEYDDGSEYEFDLEEDKEDEIIEEIADELDMDEDDVEDLIEFDYGDVEEINVDVDEDADEATVKVEYESGVTRRFDIEAGSESSMIKDIAKEIDEDEDDVEDWTNFDYL